MKDNEIYDDEVTIIGGSEWRQGFGQDDRAGSGEGLSTGNVSGSGEANGGKEDSCRNGNVRDGKSGDGGRQSDSRRWKAAAIAMCICLILLSGFFLGKHIYYNTQFPKSRPDRDIIALLSRQVSGQSGIVSGTGTAMGVDLKIYRIDGLHAHFADTVPDLSDPGIFLVTRSADYRIKDNERAYIGDFIQDGKIIASSRWRAGFMAIVDGNAQIGITRSDRIRKYTLKNRGSFFRQLAIVSAGTRCERQYILKGKVTRCAYARDEKGNLYFIETANPETLYGFADALIEYGFIDAVYVTGGSQPELFYRTADGAAYGNYIDDKPHKLVVWTRARL